MSRSSFFGRNSIVALVLASSVFTVGCGGDSSQMGSENEGEQTPAPAKIVTRGGDASQGAAGNGGAVRFEMKHADPGSSARIEATGTVDASFAMPVMPDFVPGDVPMVVSRDLAVAPYDDIAAGLASGDAFFLTRARPNVQLGLYANVDGAARPVTSIDVAAGKTLTLDMDYPDDAPYLTGAPMIELSSDLRNAGTITSVRRADGRSSANLFVTATSFYGLPGSTIRAAGDDVVSGVGGNGGDVGVVTRLHNYNQGTVLTAGGDGEVGGSGGGIFLEAHEPSADAPAADVINSGALVSRGGAGRTGKGGDAAMIQLKATWNDVYNSGVVDLSGGAGQIEGGVGTAFYMIAEHNGATRNTGPVMARGGSCSAADCDGGGGGAVIITSHGNGDFLWNAPVYANGADGRGAGKGGRGGDARFTTWQGNTKSFQPLAAGSIRVAGELALNGGKGGVGGEGGAVEVNLDAGPVGGTHEAVLVGYGAVDTAGGQAADGTQGEAGLVIR